VGGTMKDSDAFQHPPAGDRYRRDAAESRIQDFRGRSERPTAGARGGDRDRAGNWTAAHFRPADREAVGIRSVADQFEWRGDAVADRGDLSSGHDAGRDLPQIVRGHATVPGKYRSDL